MNISRRVLVLAAAYWTERQGAKRGFEFRRGRISFILDAIRNYATDHELVHTYASFSIIASRVLGEQVTGKEGGMTCSKVQCVLLEGFFESVSGGPR
jgi:hypothetical protein